MLQKHKKMIIILGSAAVVIVAVLLFLFCDFSPYTCVYRLEEREKFDLSDEGEKLSAVTLGDKELGLEYDYSTLREDGVYIDHYQIADSDRGEIEVRSDTSTIQSAWYVDAYGSFGDAAEMTDEELLQAVKSILSEDFDFSAYDATAVQRWGSGSGAYLTWSSSTSFKKMTVQVDGSGMIMSIYVSDVDPEDVPVLGISDQERDRLLLWFARRELDFGLFADVNIEIRSASPTVYKGKPAMSYACKFTNESGFGPYLLVLIY